jgi:hypothetical protein
MVVRFAVIWAKRRLLLADHPASQRHQSHVQLMPHALGMNGENAAQTAPLVLTTTFSGLVCGSKTHQPGMVARSASTVHQLMSLLKKPATSHGVQFPALVIGASSTNALPRFQSQEVSIVVEAQRLGSMS